MLKAILWRSTLAILFCGSFHNAFASCDVDPLRPAIFPPIYDVYDKFRLAALQQNLSVAEATLSLGENDDPASIDQKRVSKVGLLTAESNYVADRLRAAILAAAERLNKKGIVR